MNETISNLVDEYLSNFSSSTKRTYRNSLEAFLVYSKLSSLENPQVLKSKVKDFLEDLEAQGLKTNTLNIYLSCLKSFIKWLVETKKILVFSPIEKISIQRKNDAQKVEIPTRSEVETLLKSFNLSNRKEMKIWLGLILFLSIDKESEFVLSLKYSDIEQKLVEVCSKEQVKKIKDSVAYYIRRIEEEGEDKVMDTDYILKSDSADGSIDRSTFFRYLKNQLLSTGLNSAYNLQSCRLYAKKHNVPSDINLGEIDLIMDETIFHDDKEVRRFVEEVFRKKNVILQGPPGTGKSFLAKKMSEIITHGRDDCLFQVQMHPSFHYEDFVQGYRPDKSGNLHLVNGVFLDICEQANKMSDFNFVILIEEINRCDLNQVFGELLHLIDSSKRSSKYALKLMHQKAGETFHVPSNVYIVATMNTADRSTANIDFAMKRRFSFINIMPQLHSERFNKHLYANGFSKKDIEVLQKKILSINSEISKSKHLGEGYLIGHSYFCDSKKTNSIKEWLSMKIEYEIKPLLRDYWYDDEELVTKLTTIE